MELRRLTAKKARIEEIISGKFVHGGKFESSYVITKLGRRISRVRVMANIVDIYLNPESSFGFVVLDDASGVIRAKFFGNTQMLETLKKGDLVDVIGKLRFSDDEIWINAEIIKKIENPNFEILRMLEIAKIIKEQKEKIKKVKEHLPQTSDINELFALLGEEISKKEIESIIEAEELLKEDKEKEDKYIVLKLIEELDTGEGADYKELLEKSGLEESKLDKIIQELLETGKCFEPRPGKLKKV
ncbi:MAG TPA: hypothetical protein EYH56_01595 [Nanoarchaeota archaeon]|nr:hypothetical protein [Nanoarchaeota archaeon]